MIGLRILLTQYTISEGEGLFVSSEADCLVLTGLRAKLTHMAAEIG